MLMIKLILVSHKDPNCETNFEPTRPQILSVYWQGIIFFAISPEYVQSKLRSAWQARLLLRGGCTELRQVQPPWSLPGLKWEQSPSWRTFNKCIIIKINRHSSSND